MKRTVCDICGKEMETTIFLESIRNLNFCSSSHGRIWNICTECREDLNRWMTLRRSGGKMETIKFVHEIQEERK